MFKRIAYLISVLLVGSACIFAAEQNMPSMEPIMPANTEMPMDSMPPPRIDLMDSHSQSAQIKLMRAEQILSTLVSDPQSYCLILSSLPCIGAEAVAPHVFSDKPTMIIYEGTLAPARSTEEAAFVIAHELGHLNLYHNEKMDAAMDQIFEGPPVGFSGLTFSIFDQKLREREADLFGLDLYKKAGYDLNYFAHTLKLLKINENILFGSNQIFAKSCLSLSMNDPHFNMIERFTLLVQQAQLG